jgi:hypothetical protein
MKQLFLHSFPLYKEGRGIRLFLHPEAGCFTSFSMTAVLSSRSEAQGSLLSWYERFLRYAAK